MTYRSTHSIDIAEGHLTLSVSAVSDRGRVRSVNEDSYLAHPPVFLVADGMGGHRYGDRASSATARVFASMIEVDTPTTAGAVVGAVNESHRRVVELAEGELAGTTLSGLALVREPNDDQTRWMAFNIGDSRVYSWNPVDGLAQISVDHSAVQELIDDGSITPLQAETHPDRNVITRAVGSGDQPDPDVWIFPIADQQCFLICSDGLTKELHDDAIRAEFDLTTGDPAAAALQLVRAALEAGASDNVTVVVIDSSFQPNRAPSASGTTLAAHLERTLPREDR